MEQKIKKRMKELEGMAQQLAQQVILIERNLQGLKEQHASAQGAIIELRLLLQTDPKPARKRKQR